MSRKNMIRNLREKLFVNTKQEVYHAISWGKSMALTRNACAHGDVFINSSARIILPRYCQTVGDDV